MSIQDGLCYYFKGFSPHRRVADPPIGQFFWGKPRGCVSPTEIAAKENFLLSRG